MVKVGKLLTKLPKGLVSTKYLIYNPASFRGEVDEWFKSPPWKGGTGATLSRVRIPPSPPYQAHALILLLQALGGFVHTAALIL